MFSKLKLLPNFIYFSFFVDLLVHVTNRVTFAPALGYVLSHARETDGEKEKKVG